MDNPDQIATIGSSPGPAAAAPFPAQGTAAVPATGNSQDLSDGPAANDDHLFLELLKSDVGRVRRIQISCFFGVSIVLIFLGFSIWKSIGIYEYYIKSTADHITHLTQPIKENGPIEASDHAEVKNHDKAENPGETPGVKSKSSQEETKNSLIKLIESMLTLPTSLAGIITILVIAFSIISISSLKGALSLSPHYSNNKSPSSSTGPNGEIKLQNTDEKMSIIGLDFIKEIVEALRGAYKK